MHVFYRSLLAAGPVMLAGLDFANAASGSWAGDTSGNWEDASAWSGGNIAGETGSTATFSVNITADRTITLASPRTIGNVIFADSNAATAGSWILNGQPLTLNTSAGMPAISVSALGVGKVAVLAGPVGGMAFVKNGAGVLELAGTNNFTTPALSFAVANAGALRIKSNGALGGITSISMPSTNANIARIELAGNVVLTPAISTAGRTDTVFLRNLADSNTWSGNIVISNAGGGYAIDAAAGTLTLSGNLSTGFVSDRTFDLSGAANGIISGVVSNGSGTTGISKTGAGTWTLLGANSYTGLTTISAGELVIGSGGKFGPGNVTDNARLTFAQAGDLVVPNTIGGIGSVTVKGLGKLTVSGPNSYSGGTLMDTSGTLSVAHNAALGTGLVTLGKSVGAGQLWFHAAGDRTLNNNFEIRTQRWIIDGSQINGSDAGTLTVTGNVYLNQSGAKDVYCNQSLTLAGAVTSTSGLTKQGGNPLTLAGTATYAGATSIAEGNLIVTGSLTSAATTTVNAETTLSGTGAISGPVAVSGGASLVPGVSGAGKLQIGSLSLAAASILQISAGASTDPTNTQIAVSGNLSLNGNLRFVAKSGFTSGIYTIATYSGNLVGTGFQSMSFPPGYIGSLITTAPGELKIRVIQAGAVSPVTNVMLPMAASVIMEWNPPPGAVSYDLYLGTSAATVGGATSVSPAYKGRLNSEQFTASGFASGTTNYWRVDYIFADGTVFKGPVWNFTLVQENDLMADTWVATDGLNRTLPGAALVGPPRDDRPIAIFYFLWHNKNGLGNDGPRDNNKEINRLGGYTDPREPWQDNPLWMNGGSGRSWYWGEPEAGYYSSDDEWVIRRHISLLVAAGVDILAFDNTNGHPETYQASYTKIAETIRKMRKEGMKIDLKFMFVTHGGAGGSPATMTWLYENFYKPNLYPEMWLMWNGKPAIVGYPDGINGDGTPVTTEVRGFFTIRTGWANTSSTLREWQWIDSTTPQNWGYDTRADIPEQVPVACGGWCNNNLGRSYLNRAQPAYDKFHLTTGRTEGQGRFYAEQSYYGQKLDPKLLFITGWNEWWAGAWSAPAVGGGYNLLNNQCQIGERYFVDNYNSEYSRDIEPMKGGFGDNYYYQMVAANRRRKGARTTPIASAAQTVTSPAAFANVGPVYYDAPDETLPRNAQTTFSNLPNYTNTTGRNDFRVLKVARDASNLYFYAETKAAISAATGQNWMLLFLDTDQSRSTGWEGYDYALNLGGSGQVKRFASTTWTPADAGSATVSVAGNKIVITVARATLGLTANPLTVDFHWADNLQTLGDIADFGVSGDSAPERRFNYRYKTAPEEPVMVVADSFEPGDPSAAGTASSWAETLGAGGQWKISTVTPYTGGRCLIGTGATTTTDTGGTLINRSSTAGLNSLRVAFRYKLANVKDAQNIQIYYRNSSNQWIAVRELGRDQYHATGQAWGYDEKQNVWLYFSDARLNTGTDAAYFHPNFAIHIQASGLKATNQTVAIDDFEITGTRTMSLPALASAPNPANGAEGIATTTSLSWTPGGGASSQQIFFGTTGNLQPLAIIDGQAASQVLTVVPGPGTQYAWRVDSINPAGTTTGPLWTFTTALPPNGSPSLATIADRVVIAGQTIAFAAAASDPDLPAQALTFALEGQPTGATIHADSGQFTWRPSQNQAPGDYAITVKVKDNGVPPLSAQRTFVVQVKKPVAPQAKEMARGEDGIFRFEIMGDVGPDYRVMISDDLTNWNLLRTIASPTPPFLFEDNDAKNAPKRFYKFELGP